jgi:hypothetical protein
MSRGRLFEITGGLITIGFEVCGVIRMGSFRRETWRTQSVGERRSGSRGTKLEVLAEMPGFRDLACGTNNAQIRLLS